MKLIKLLAAAAVLATPLLVSAAPADAATARQYEHQGRGHYISSKGRSPSRAIYHRHSRHHGPMLHRRYR